MDGHIKKTYFILNILIQMNFNCHLKKLRPLHPNLSLLYTMSHDQDFYENMRISLGCGLWTTDHDNEISLYHIPMALVHVCKMAHIIVEHNNFQLC